MRTFRAFGKVLIACSLFFLCPGCCRLACVLQPLRNCFFLAFVCPLQAIVANSLASFLFYTAFFLYLCACKLMVYYEVLVVGIGDCFVGAGCDGRFSACIAHYALPTVVGGTVLQEFSASLRLVAIAPAFGGVYKEFPRV